MKQPHKTNSDSVTHREQQYDEFVGLLSRHDQVIRRYVRSLLPSVDGVDDVVQETALECWKKYSDFRPDKAGDAAEEFVRWACVIARFKVLSWQRDKGRDRLVFRESVIEKLAEASVMSPDQVSEEREAAKACLAELSGDQRRLVLSVHVPGESVARIAEETGVNARQLYSKVNALRIQLLECTRKRLSGKVANG